MAATAALAGMLAVPAEVAAARLAGSGPQVSFNGVTVGSGSDAWAVGGAGKDDGPVRTLIEHWNGREFRRVRVPGVEAPSRLYSVATTSRTDGWAVGYQSRARATRTLTEHWNGSAWKVVRSPDPNAALGEDVLYSVAATSRSNAWAVGLYQGRTTLGYDERALIVHWNGRNWTRVPKLPVPGSFDAALFGVSATSRSSAWAVGYSGDQVLILHWNGAAWTRMLAGQAGSMSAATAVSGSDAWAVGTNDRHALFLHWDGTRWRRVSAADPCGSRSELLNGISAAGASSAWAVGQCANASDTKGTTLTEHWNGSTWKRVPSPDVAGSTQNMLYGVAALRSGAWAAGWYGTSRRYRTLVEHWNGGHWRRVAS